MLRRLLPVTLAIATGLTIPACAAAADHAAGLSASHRPILMRKRITRRSASGTGVVTGGKQTATGGTPGGMPSRQ